VTSHVYEKQMGITHRDFFRLLPFALGTDQFSATSNSASLKAGKMSVDIELGAEGNRQIALLAIPTTPVKMTLNGFSDSEMEAFMTNFERAYQRGGG